MMKRLGLYTAGFVALALLTFTASSVQSSSAASPAAAAAIGAGNVLLGDEEVTSGGLTVRAFVPTDSLSPNCLATFSESNFAVPGLTLFCGSRVFNGQKGLLISVFPPQVIPTGLILSLTVYQQGARGYGTPVLYTGE
jgi:hypothetical protein